MATVLVVDDAADNRDLVRTVLRHHGHSTVEAEGGEQALALLADSRLLPDLVLTDLQMPGMDGTELANAIWAEPATETVPVLFYTAGYPSELIDRLDADRPVNIVRKDGDLVALVDAVEDALRAAVPGLRSASEIVALLDQLPAVVAYWDRNVRNRFANFAYFDWFGFSPRDMRGMHMRDILGVRGLREEPRAHRPGPRRRGAGIRPRGARCERDRPLRTGDLHAAPGRRCGRGILRAGLRHHRTGGSRGRARAEHRGSRAAQRARADRRRPARSRHPAAVRRRPRAASCRRDGTGRAQSEDPQRRRGRRRRDRGTALVGTQPQERLGPIGVDRRDRSGPAPSRTGAGLRAPASPTAARWTASRLRSDTICWP